MQLIPSLLQLQVEAVVEVHSEVLDEGEEHWLGEKSLVKEPVGVDRSTKVHHQLKVRVS